MKKLITPLFLIALMLTALISKAQSPGYTINGIYDDFATTEMYADPNPSDPNNPDGIYWWGKEATGADPKDPSNTDPCVLNHKNTLTRSGNGKMEMSVSQGSECWQPFGISTKLDLSNNASFEVSITNNSSAAIYFDVYIADGNKNVINTNSSQANLSAPTIAPGETKILSGDFTGGYYKKWVNGVAEYSQNLNFSNVTDVSFTVVSADQPESNNWGPVAISNASVTMNYFKLGLKTSSANSISAATYEVYPNPSTSGVVNFSSTQTNIKIFDAVGTLVYSAASGSTITTDGFTSGIYTIITDEGAKKLLIQ